MTSKAVLELVAGGRLERVPKNRAQAARMLQSCSRHVESAEARAAADPTGSYALLYDAARKAVAAHMLAVGLRVANRPGAHAATVAYAESALVKVVPADDLGHLDRMRRIRHDTEYDERPVTEREVRSDLAHARSLVQAVTRTLFPPKKPAP